MKHIREYVAVGFALFGVLYLLGYCTGCGMSTGEARALGYSTELQKCSLQAATLCDSIECENRVRAQYGRPAREPPASCTDGGAR